jgi:elongation factor G
MKQYKTHEIRNVGLFGHGSSGKTSVAEAILFVAAVSDRLGRVGDNSSVMDNDPDEIKCGHSINASLAFYEWDKQKINLLDTPGSSNFIADTIACHSVVDGAVIVVSAVEGIQFYTEKVWRWADEQLLGKIIFINKVDHELADFAQVLESLKRKTQKKFALIQIPVGQGGSFSCVVDLVKNGCLAYDKDGNGKGRIVDIPLDMAEEIEIYRAELVEAVAETSDELLEKYLEIGELSQDEFLSGLKHGVAEGKIIPVLCGCATLNIGIDGLMQAIVDYLPSPENRGSAKGRSLKDGSEVVLMSDEKSPLTCLAFKTISDTYTGKLTLCRVFSGTMKADSSVYNLTRQTNERVGHIFALQGKKQVQMDEMVAGDIGAVPRLKVTATGDTLGNVDSTTMLDPIKFPIPVMARAILPKTRSDEEKISNALHRLVEEDPTLRVDRAEQTHELLIYGMGQVHLDLIVERMKRRYGVDVDVKSPKVPYLETIRGTFKVQGRHKKQTGGHGQFADIWIEISPLQRGGGFQFENKIVGGAIPKQYVPAVEKGVREAMAEGVLAHYPMTDVRVQLYDGSYHDVDSSELAFKIAGSLGFKKGVPNCNPILLEPIMLMDVSVPSNYVGDVIGDLNSKRGKILGIEGGDDNQVIKAHVPMSTILNYAADLTALTAGKGSYVVEFVRYDDVPEHIVARVVETAQALRQSGNKD